MYGHEQHSQASSQVHTSFPDKPRQIPFQAQTEGVRRGMWSTGRHFLSIDKYHSTYSSLVEKGLTHDRVTTNNSLSLENPWRLVRPRHPLE